MKNYFKKIMTFVSDIETQNKKTKRKLRKNKNKFIGDKWLKLNE